MILNQAVILCGGEGRRLNDITKNTPKTMLKVNGNQYKKYKKKK